MSILCIQCYFESKSKIFLYNQYLAILLEIYSHYCVWYYQVGTLLTSTIQKIILINYFIFNGKLGTESLAGGNLVCCNG